MRLPNLKFNRRAQVAIAAFALLGLAVGLFALIDPVRPPPSIFDNPADDVLDFLADEDFNRLSVEERMTYLQGLLSRFGGKSQADSAAAAAFLAGLTGPTNERLTHNARILGKDVLVQGAAEFLSQQTEAERAAFLDQWIVKWVRFGEDAAGEHSGRSDEELLSRLSSQANRDVERGINIDAQMAQQVIDFWDRDVLSVTTPKEQAQIYQFLPALRNHILRSGSK